jgi:hypothetical protein
MNSLFIQTRKSQSVKLALFILLDFFLRSRLIHQKCNLRVAFLIKL